MPTTKKDEMDRCRSCMNLDECACESSMYFDLKDNVMRDLKTGEIIKET